MLVKIFKFKRRKFCLDDYNDNGNILVGKYMFFYQFIRHLIQREYPEIFIEFNSFLHRSNLLLATFSSLQQISILLINLPQNSENNLNKNE